MNYKDDKYLDQLNKLQKELSDRRNKQRKKGYDFNKNQEEIFNFVQGKKSLIQLEINGEQYFMKKGDKEGGFMHILLKHYADKEQFETKEGEVASIDILNIANVIKNGDPMNEHEITKDKFKDKVGFKQEKNGKTYKVILTKERNGNWFVTLYSNFELKTDEEPKN